ncbi:hypothetical protein CPC08DRAFT_816440 [Agrocybe pediades]|nr:hypothetical protein CPC08DRAFT_816440 [Agrocybe pediades]
MRLLQTTGLRRASTLVSSRSRFLPSRLDRVEDIEDYQPRGFHPISIGDTFDHGRFRVLHKLGFGGSSTVWLARDHAHEQDSIVTLKALRSSLSSSSRSDQQLPGELAISQKIKDTFLPQPAKNFRIVDHHFSVVGPNGTHFFLVAPFAGPSIAALYDCPGRTSGSRRIRADLARKVAKRTAQSLLDLHQAGIVHGGIFDHFEHPAPHMLTWSDAEVYAHLGNPKTETVQTNDGRPIGLTRPQHSWTLSKTPDYTTLPSSKKAAPSSATSDNPTSQPQLLHPPTRTLINYISPEARFTRRASFEADVWSLGCAIFEIRAGFPLFEPFLGSDAIILKKTVETLGRLPDPWWNAFAQRKVWFEEDGRPKSQEEHERAGVMLTSRKTSIREKLLEIGKDVDEPFEEEGPFIEKAYMEMTEGEADMLTDLLEKMLKYRP